MRPTTKEFLTKLAALLEEYQVEITIEESCSGYSGFTADGLEFEVTYSTEEGYKRSDYVHLRGTWFSIEDFKEKLNEL